MIKIYTGNEQATGMHTLSITGYFSNHATVRSNTLQLSFQVITSECPDEELEPVSNPFNHKEIFLYDADYLEEFAIP